MANTLRDAVREALDDRQIADAIGKMVKEAVHEANQENYDPYRTTIHFLVGLTAFCLSVIVGIFTALRDPPVRTYTLTYHMLGGVLAWIAITALVATFCAAFAQLRKSPLREHPKNADGTKAAPWKGERATLMLLPALSGAMAVVYSAGAGLAIMNNNLGPLGNVCAICKLWPF